MKRNKPNASLQMLFLAITLAMLTVALLLLAGFVFKESESSAEAWSSPDITVIIDPGHGGEDGGASSKNGIIEKDLNLSIAKKLKELLDCAGIESVMTRSDDRLLYDPLSDHKGKKKLLDMHERLNITKKYENAVFISIHMNSFPEEKYSGLQVYYSPNDDRSSALASTIQSTVSGYLQPNNHRKTKPGRNIFLLERISHPAVLIECGFLSNAEESALLASEDYQNELSFWIFYSIVSEIQQKDLNS